MPFIPRRFKLSRRAMLGGAGALIALPWLEAMGPRARQAAAAPGDGDLRLLCYYLPNGLHMQSWTPQAEGPGFDVPLLMQPLAALQDDLLVLTGLANEPAKPEGPGDHASGTAGFLTCRHVKKSETDIQNGISLDQLLAQHIGAQTKHPSLQLGTQGGGNAGGCDSGYSCAYTRNISWADEASPVPKVIQPQVIFDLLFGGFDPGATAEELAKRKARRLSVLDYVSDDIAALHAKLGAADRAKLDQYLTGVSELEKRVEDEDAQPVCELPAFDGNYVDFPAHVDLMTDLMVLAFQCDISRVITFMLENAGSYRTYDFLGINEAHHEISHHMDLPANFAKLEVINTWEIEQFAKLVQRLKDAPDGPDTSILDNTVIFLSSEVSDGNWHNHNNLPVLLAGSAGGQLNTGRHVIYPGEPAMADLFISILGLFGVDVASFGDNGTGPLPGLT